MKSRAAETFFAPFNIAIGSGVITLALDGSGAPTPSTPASVTSGGRDTSAASYGYVAHDYDGAVRTVPYSIGAYER